MNSSFFLSILSAAYQVDDAEEGVNFAEDASDDATAGARKMLIAAVLNAVHSRCHHNSWLAFQRLQPLRYLHSCSGCFRLELSPGGALTHWEAPPYHGARHLETFDGISGCRKAAARHTVESATRSHPTSKYN